MIRTRFLLWAPKGTLRGSSRKLALEQWYSIWGGAIFWKAALKMTTPRLTQTHTCAHRHTHAELAGESDSILWHDRLIVWMRKLKSWSGWPKVTIHPDLGQEQSSFLSQCLSVCAPASGILPNPAPRCPLCFFPLDPGRLHIGFGKPWALNLLFPFL